jgi:carbon storage regulator
MLVLSRRIGEEIIIGGNIHVTVVAVQGDRVRLGITAPRSVCVDRQEVRERRFAVPQESDDPCLVHE